MAKKEAGNYLSIGFLILGVLAVAYILNVGITGFAVSEVQSNFSQGVYENTSFDNGNISLTGENLSGSYTSEVFESNESVLWNNLTWEGNVPNSKTINVINESGWVNSTGYTLANFSSFWTDLSLTSLYDSENNNSINVGNASLNSSTGTLTNASNFSWNDVLISYEYDMEINSSLSFQVRASEDANFTNSSFETVSDVNNLNLTGQYFQYKVIFETSDFELSPSISSIELSYGEEDSIPGCTDSDAINYDENATEDDGSCEYEEVEEETNETGTEEEVGETQSSQDTQGTQEDFSNLASLSASKIDNVKLNPGDSTQMSWKVINDGEGFLFSCEFSTSGENSDWISFEGEQRNINPDEEVNFNFDIEIPNETEESDYSIQVSVDCSSTSVSETFVLTVEEKKIDFELIDAQRTRQDRVRILYSLSELTGEDQEVEISFTLSDEEGTEFSSISENKSINANGTEEFRTNLGINESLNGTLLLSILYNSEVYSSSVVEPITIGAPIGFAVFEGIGAGEAYILIAVVLILGVLFFIVRRMRKSKKTIKSLVGTNKKDNK
ncbi:MAG: hypothetical protein WDZ62_00730 [Candidatus Pacearchaeota archaeon]